MKKLLLPLFLLLGASAQAQVKIGSNPGTIDANSLLELEATNKGFLPPRVTLTSLTSVSPLTGTVPAGMMVYNSAGSLSYGYYYWDGSEWKKIENGYDYLVTKTATATLTKSERIVLASNDIILTLPTVTSSDNGLQITIKNIGSHTDLVTVKGNGSATIDGVDSSDLTRHMAQTFTAYGGNWVVKNKIPGSKNILDVNANSSWTTIDEAIEFLGLHMSGPSILRLTEETYDVSATIDIDLPYSLTIQGSSYSNASINAASGLAGTPMFRCLSDCYFKMLNFDATTLTNYGTATGEDAIRFLGSGSYNEVKDCSFDRFYNTILDSVDAEIWVFETDISNSQGSGILVHGAEDSVTVKVAETDFIGCNYGINLSKGSKATIQLASGGYYNGASGDTAIFYQPSTFTNYISMSITGNSWNNTGKYIEGFDFTRTDGRDANVILESNAGMGDQKPNCFINVLNSSTTKTLTTQNSWYVADWGSNTSSETCKWTIASNKITYQPNNKRNGIFTVSGNLSVNSSSQNISIGIVKNGNSSVRYGETTLRVTTSDQPFQFSFIAYLADIAPGDYFEIYYSNATSGSKVVKIQDIQWLANTQ
ncbi:MAG: hypothetical protein HZB42_13930 [Sphingobacteriales bacterium]|nr:hypothetical protein [Sphingobacteriales bacterium]